MLSPKIVFVVVDLSVPEWNVREILKVKLISLLKQQKDIPETKRESKVAPIWYAGTKLFHASTVIRHKNNLITQLDFATGEPTFSHEGVRYMGPGYLSTCIPAHSDQLGRRRLV
jgi:hypothetical protein